MMINSISSKALWIPSHHLVRRNPTKPNYNKDLFKISLGQGQRIRSFYEHFIPENNVVELKNDIESEHGFVLNKLSETI